MLLSARLLEMDVEYYQFAFYFHQFWQNLIMFCVWLCAAAGWAAASRLPNKRGENYLKRQN